jgi:hypothetical protein
MKDSMDQNADRAIRIRQARIRSSRNIFLKQLSQAGVFVTGDDVHFLDPARSSELGGQLWTIIRTTPKHVIAGWDAASDQIRSWAAAQDRILLFINSDAGIPVFRGSVFASSLQQLYGLFGPDMYVTTTQLESGLILDVDEDGIFFRTWPNRSDTNVYS